MVVVILENASESLRGMMTRWMIETKPGVFVGSFNSRIREKLWGMIQKQSPEGALMIYSYNNEQGFQIEMFGDPTRTLVDIDGLQLIKRQ